MTIFFSFPLLPLLLLLQMIYFVFILAPAASASSMSSDSDFYSLNQILKNISVHVPTLTAYKSDIITVDLENLVCNRLRVGYVGLFPSITDEKVEAISNASGLSVDCTLKASTKVDSVDIHVASSSTSMELHVDLSGKPVPSSVSVSNCVAKAPLSTFDLGGSELGKILNTIKGLFQPHVTSEIEKVVCDELKSLFSGPSSLVPSVLNEAKTFFEKYLNDPVSSETFMEEAMEGERLLKAPPARMKLADLRANKALQWLNVAVEHYLDRQPSGKLGINTIVDELTNATGVLTIPLDGALILNTTVGNNTIAVHANSVNISGLDSFTEFHPLDVLSKYTLRQTMSLSRLSIAVNVTLRAVLFKGGDSVVRSNQPGGVHVVENAVLTFAARDVGVDVAVLAAIDSNGFKNLKFGSVYTTPTACLLSTVYATNITALNISVGSLLPFKVMGAVSPGVEALFDEVINMAFMMYGDVGLDILPTAAQTTLRDALNGALQTFIYTRRAAGCRAQVWLGTSNFTADNEFTRLRDKVQGIVGGQKGADFINHDLLDSVLKKQSGEAHVLNVTKLISSDLKFYEFTKNITMTTLRLLLKGSLSDMTLSNLDTVSNVTFMQSVSAEKLHTSVDIADLFAGYEP